MNEMFNCLTDSLLSPRGGGRCMLLSCSAQKVVFSHRVPPPHTHTYQYKYDPVFYYICVEGNGVLGLWWACNGRLKLKGFLPVSQKNRHSFPALFLISKETFSLYDLDSLLLTTGHPNTPMTYILQPSPIIFILISSFDSSTAEATSLFSLRWNYFK